MKKLIKNILMVAALVCGTMSLTSCDEIMESIFGEWDKPTPENPTSNPESTPDGSKDLSFTATISSIIAENTDGTLETSWKAGEEVALVHQDKNGDTVVDKVTISAVDATTKVATISGIITGSPADGTEAKLIYPASAANENGDVGADLLNVQDGTLATISEKFDKRICEDAKLKVTESNATIDGTANLKNPLAVIKFSLKENVDGTPALAAESFKITDISGQPIITVNPSSGSASELYVAMAPATAQTFGFIAKKGDVNYCFSKSGVTIATNTYYQQPLALADMLHTPLTLQAAVAGAKVTFKACNANLNSSARDPKTIEYSTDGGANWTTGNTGDSGVEVTLANVGDKVMFRGDNSNYGTKYEGTSSGDYRTYNNISCTADCYVYGNIMSLINKTGFATLTELTATHTFFGLFNDNDHLLSNPAFTLELPATTLTESCYNAMFNGCTSLVTPPALPATELKDFCYSNLFSGCSSLTTAPELPATTLAVSCYNLMFDGCKSLATAPALPATELKMSCYAFMFNGCSNLKEAWVKAEYDASSCNYMFTDCKSGGVLHTASTSTAWTPGTAMPGDWTIKKDY